MTKTTDLVGNFGGSANPDGADDPLVRYPEELAQQYRDQGFWRDRTIAEEFHATALAHPDNIALLDTRNQYTYAELDELTDRIAAGLADLGLQPGERVLLQVTNHAKAIVAWYSLLKAGLVPVATLAQHRRHELSEISRQAEPVAHLVEPDYTSFDLVGLAKEIASIQPTMRQVLTLNASELVEGTVALESLGADRDTASARLTVEAIQDGISPEDIGVIQLSGGTTAIPKLIPRLHAEYWYNSRAYAEAIGLDNNGQVAHILPIVHNAGVVCALHAAHSVGAGLAVAAHDGKQLRDLARSGRISHMLISPPMGKIVLEHDDLREALVRHMRVITWILGAVPPEFVEVFETDKCRFTQMFGMGEGLCMFTPTDAPVELRQRIVGVPISPLDEVKLLEPGTETPVEPGEQGEMCCRGPYTIRGYYAAAERNRTAFTSDHFYRTGDMMVEVTDGSGRRYFSLADRLKDVISRGGEKINAGEVEELLLRHPDIEQAAVVAMPDPVLGERACAFIVPNPNSNSTIDVADVASFFEDLGVAKFKTPEWVEIREELPMTGVTKIRKADLRAEIAAIVATKRQK